MIVMENISHFYGNGGLRQQILFGITVEIQPGEIVILTGPSGSGKTTLLSLLGALRTVQQGSLKILGKELHGATNHVLVSLRRRIGYIFQGHNLLDSLTALQNVQVPLLLRRDLGRREAVQKSMEALDSVGLSDCAKRYPNELSGGQKQRVAIARALVGDPRIILADEPTASLDSGAGRDIADRLRTLAKRQGCAAVVVTHDERILDIADRVLELEDGRLSHGH